MKYILNLGKELMKIKSILLLFIFVFYSIVGYSQNYISPKKVTAGLTVAIEIKDKKELDYVQKNLSKFYGVQFLRVNGNLDIDKVSKVIEMLDDVEDVQLINFGGEFNEEVIDRLDWVNNITIFLKNGKEDQVLMTSNIGKLRKLTLIFEIAPTDFSFIDNLTQVRKLHLIAPFVKKEAKAAVVAVSKLKYLEDFGISLDRILDLPVEIKGIANLKELSIYDNLSWITEKYLENLPQYKKTIEYTVNEKDKYVNFRYQAMDIELTPYDYNHLYTVFPAGRMMAIVSNNQDTVTYSDFAEFRSHKPLENEAFRKEINGTRIIPEYLQNQFYLEGDNSKDKVYYLGSDVVVMVPKNAFVYENGETVEGAYNLSLYAGLRAVEMSNLGLNMQTRDSVLSPKILLEIDARLGKEKLKVKEGYFIKVTFLNVVDTATQFYAYDEKTKKWQNYYDYDYYFDDTKIVPIDFYNFYTGKKTATEAYPGNTADLDDRFETQGYYYLLDPGVAKQTFESNGGYYFSKKITKGNEPGTYTIRRGAKLVGLKKEYLDKKVDKGVVKFRVYDKTATLFPELKVFDNYVFEVETSMSPRLFSQQFISGKNYSDVRFVKEGGSYFLQLKTDEGYWNIKLLQPSQKLSLKGKKAKLAQAEFLRRMNKYFTERTQKNTRLIQYYNNYSSTNILNSKRQLLLGSVKPKGMVVREFKVRSTGAFTMASAHLISDSFAIKALITDKGGIPINTKRIAMVHINPTVINWYEVTKSDEFTLLKINPKRFGYLLSVDDKGVVYYINLEQFKLLSLIDNTVIYLPMQELPRPQRTTIELEKILNIYRKNY